MALGRKSWLFADSDCGGLRAAAMYSLVVTAKMNDVDPDRPASPMELEAEGSQTRRLTAATRGSHRMLSMDLEPQGHWKTITFVAALRQNGMTAPCTIDGAMNGGRFLTYIEHCLAPTLKQNDM